MRELKFIIDKQKITRDKDCDFSAIASGSVGYLKAVFEFSSDWDGYLKVAEFRENLSDDPCPVPVFNNSCIIPETVLSGRHWFVNVVGKKGDLIIPTDKHKVFQEV